MSKSLKELIASRREDIRLLQFLRDKTLVALKDDLGAELSAYLMANKIGKKYSLEVIELDGQQGYRYQFKPKEGEKILYSWCAFTILVEVSTHEQLLTVKVLLPHTRKEFVADFPCAKADEIMDFIKGYVASGIVLLEDYSEFRTNREGAK